MKKLFLTGLLGFTVQVNASDVELPTLNLDLTQISVSGVSSGGYMATQFHIAHSDWVKGAGIIAAGPYYCGQNAILTALGNCVHQRTTDDLEVLNSQLKEWAKSGKVASLDNLKDAKVWLFHGTKDEKVIAPVSDALAEQYSKFVEQVKYVNNKPFAHHFPTLESGTDCATSAAPYLGACNYDAAGELLQFTLGELKPKAKSSSGKLINLEQQNIAGEDAASMAETGYAYVPANCESGTRCKLHISFHGCNQYAEAADVGQQFVLNSGLNQWADTNDLVILYPQAKASRLMPMNPQECWDWWGYTDENYATKEGKQIKAVTALANKLAGI